MNNEIVPGFANESDNSLNLRLQKIEGLEGGLVIYASGYIDTYNSSSFRKRTEKAVEAGFVRLIVDMSGVNFASSTGVGALVYLLKLVKSRNGDVVIQGIQPRVNEVLQLLGFSQFFPFKENLNESIACLAGRQRVAQLSSKAFNEKGGEHEHFRS
jgi:anti-anti-sigma factor